MTTKPKSEMLSRRQALSLLGLAGATAYAIPTVLTVSDAEAGGEVHIRTRRERSRRRTSRVEIEKRPDRDRTRRRTHRGFGH